MFRRHVSSSALSETIEAAWMMWSMSVGDPECFRMLKLSENELDVKAPQAVEVRRLADQAVHVPAAGQEMPAEVRADEPVGARDQKFIHVFPPRRAAAFQALTNAGAAIMARRPVRMPNTVSER